MNQEEEKRIIKWAKNILGNNSDKFDIVSEIDRSLTVGENKTILRDNLKGLIELSDKEKAEQAKEMYEEMMAEEKRAEEERIEAFENRETEKITIHSAFKPVQSAVKRLIDGFEKFVIIKGKSGTGKSLTIENTLKENNKEYVEITGFVSPAFLYRVLYENRDSLVWLRECTGIFDNERSLNMLKSAIENQEGSIITKQTYSKADEDIPDRFLYKGKLITDLNEIHSSSKFNEDLKAVHSRAKFIEILFSPDEMIDLMREVAKDDFESEVTEFLITNYEDWGIPLDLRIQRKYIETAKYYKNNNKDWKEEILNELTLNKGKEYKIIYNLIGKQVVRLSELLGKLIVSGKVSSYSTARQLVNNAIISNQLFKCSSDERNYKVSLNKELSVEE
jgi:hypothetical protein